MTRSAGPFSRADISPPFSIPASRSFPSLSPSRQKRIVSRPITRSMQSLHHICHVLKVSNSDRFRPSTSNLAGITSLILPRYFYGGKTTVIRKRYVPIINSYCRPIQHVTEQITFLHSHPNRIRKENMISFPSKHLPCKDRHSCGFSLPSNHIPRKCVCVFFTLKPLFLPVDIQHNQCPCRFSNPRRDTSSAVTKLRHRDNTLPRVQ